MTDEEILGVLDTVLHGLGDLLAEKSAWNSLHITYEPPRVERLWRQHGEYRIFLHRIYPLQSADARPLYHPHPWPSAVRLVSGRYRHKIGAGGPVLTEHDEHSVRVLCSQVLTAGSSYAMTNSSTWHSVEPIDGSSDSVMVIGPPYPVRPDMQHVDVPMVPLDPKRFDELYDTWCHRAWLHRSVNTQKQRASRISRRLHEVLAARVCKICGFPTFNARGEITCVHGHVQPKTGE